jgi:hypothetical protein
VVLGLECIALVHGREQIVTGSKWLFWFSLFNLKVATIVVPPASKCVTSVEWFNQGI